MISEVVEVPDNQVGLITLILARRFALIFVEYSGLENCVCRNNRAPLGAKNRYHLCGAWETRNNRSSETRLELPTSTLPVLRSSQMR